MKKQPRTAIAAMLLLSAISLHAQMTTTTMTSTAAAADTQATSTARAKTTSAKSKKKKAAPKPHVESATERQLRELQTQMTAQQAEIDALKQQNADKDAALANAQSTAAAAQSQAAAATTATQTVSSSVQANTDAITSVKSDVSDLKITNTGLATTISATKTELNDKIESPSSIHYKGITITPVAFFAFEGVWRERSVNSDINTPFNAIPLPGANQGHVSELNFSGRQSRLGGLFEGNAGPFKLSGYFESDFLGTGTSSNNNQSNSYVLRQRQIWGKAETTGGLALTGGQMWSLVTENGASTNNRTEKLPNTIDPQYMVGFSWARQPGLRLQQRFGDLKTGAATIAMSLEQAQITGFTASGQIPANFFFAGNGQNGGLYNAAGNAALSGPITTYANNTAPDVIVKAAFDLPKAHMEIGGLARFLRVYYFPILTTSGTATATTYTYAPNYISNTKSAGGVFGSIRVSPSKLLDLAVQAMAGQGVGRYGSSQLADATLRPDGTLEPIRNYHGMFSIESHPTPKLDVFGYYGAEYAQRTIYVNGAGGLIGYGPGNLNDAGCYNLPSNPGGGGSSGSIAAAACASPTRYIQEGMLGFTYRAVNMPRYGRLQYSATYTFLQRNLWSGVGSASTPTGPRAEDNMIHVGMRYYIP